MTSDHPDREPDPAPSDAAGSEPPSLFWRRRGYWLLLLGAAVVALGLTFASRLQ